MADETRTKTRIYELAEATTLSADMNIPVDTESGGTKRIQMSTLIDENLDTEGKAADAKAVGDALATKVDAAPGKGLSANDYTTAEKTKLAGIQERAAAVDSTLSVSGKAADAKKTGDEITLLKQDISEFTRLDGVTVSGDLTPTATEKGDGGFYWTGSAISPITYANYRYYKIPVKENVFYATHGIARWWIVVDSNGNRLTSGEANDSSIRMPQNAVSFWVTYNTNKYPDFAVFESVTVPNDKRSFDTFPDTVRLGKVLTAEMVDGFEWGNLKNALSLIASGMYPTANAIGGVISFSHDATLNTYILDAEAKVYHFSNQARFVLPVDENNLATAIQSTYVTTFDNTDGTAKKLYIAISSTNFADMVIYTDSAKNVYPVWLEELKPKTILGSYIDRFIGDYTGEIALDAISSSVSSNLEYAFCGDIAGWGANSSIEFALYSSGSSSDMVKFTIDSNNIVLTYDNYGTTATVTEAHGLTIENNIQLHIKRTLNGIYNLTLTSNGVTYTHEFSATSTRPRLYPVIRATNVTPTGCSASWACRDIQKETWCFGDSYFGATTDQRWVYYLNNDGYYEGHLFDNYPGENSPNALDSLKALLKYGIPKRIFWALGMNDGSDSGTTPSTTWMNSLNAVIGLCNMYDIELILATIPTVPSISHEAKNTFVRNSGYQYVDFAKAVGATSSGVWFSGMLGSDNVHPTAKGARALYGRVLSDFPQITIKDR